MAAQEELFSIFNFSITSTHRTAFITKTISKLQLLQHKAHPWKSDTSRKVAGFSPQIYLKFTSP